MNPDLTAYRKLIVFGGTFDPPHRAHIELPRQVMHLLGAECVLYIPAAKPPHKRDSQQSPAKHRLAMLRFALQDFPQAVLRTDEIDRAADGRPSYTVDTLRALRQQLHPQATLRLLIGADQVHIFDQWHEAQAITELAEPVVMVRPPDTRDSLLESLPESQRATWARRVVTLPTMIFSSTNIRKAIAQGVTLSDEIVPQVAAYIAEHELYR